MIIHDNEQKRDLTWTGKDYGDVERVIKILQWLDVPFEDVYGDEFKRKNNLEYKAMGLRK